MNYMSCAENNNNNINLRCDTQKMFVQYLNTKKCALNL